MSIKPKLHFFFLKNYFTIFQGKFTKIRRGFGVVRLLRFELRRLNAISNGSGATASCFASSKQPSRESELCGSAAEENLRTWLAEEEWLRCGVAWKSETHTPKSVWNCRNRRMFGSQLLGELVRECCERWLCGESYARDRCIWRLDADAVWLLSSVFNNKS